MENKSMKYFNSHLKSLFPKCQYIPKNICIHHSPPLVHFFPWDALSFPKYLCPFRSKVNSFPRALGPMPFYPQGFLLSIFVFLLLSFVLSAPLLKLSTFYPWLLLFCLQTSFKPLPSYKKHKPARPPSQLNTSLQARALSLLSRRAIRELWGAVSTISPAVHSARGNLASIPLSHQVCADLLAVKCKGCQGI